MRVRLRDGTRLYFDVAGMGLVPEGPLMRERPTLLCLHGGPGFDHSLLKSALAPLADTAQVVFLDHRGQGRSDRSAPDRWNLDTWIEDVVDFCGALELEHPVVLGQSFGGVVALGVAIRHPDLVARLIVSSSIGRSTTRRRSIGTRSHYRPAPGGRVPLLPRRGIHLRLVRRARADPVPEPDPRRRPRPDHHPRRSRRAGRGDPRLAARGLRRRRPRLPRQARGGAERDPGVRGRSVVGRAPRPGVRVRMHTRAAWHARAFARTLRTKKGEHDYPGERGRSERRLAHAYVSAAPRLELRCESCGYGVVVRVRPPFCPMCGGHGWEYAAWRPFSARPPQRIA